ncbi:MAG: TolC family protein [Cephaloticoccus sp.]|nr:TolC family protein [Cephaloticoccus sp.]MCF7758927.1 TolC family protein [Cephaloticoccus sp.]
MKIPAAALLLVLGPVCAVVLADPAEPVTPATFSLAECLAYATAHQPALAAAQAGVTAATASVGEARAPYYPQVDLNAGYHRWQRRAFLPSGLTLPGKPIPDQIGPLNDWTGGLSTRVTLYDFGERRAGLAAASARKAGAEADVVTTQADVRLSTQLAFHALATAQDLQAVAEKNLNRTEHHLSIAQIRRSAGDVPQADVLRLQAEVAHAQLQLIGTQSNVRICTGRLNTVMGRAAEAPLHIAVDHDIAPPPTPEDLGPAINRALAQRSELNAAEKRTDAARAMVNAARAGRAPKLRADAAFGWNDTTWVPETQEWQAGLSIDVPVFDAGRRTHRIARSRAELAREQAALETRQLQIRQEVWAASVELERSWAAIAANETALRASEESLRVVQERYQNGGAVVTDLLDTQTALARTEASLAGARWDYLNARAAYDRAIGATP